MTSAVLAVCLIPNNIDGDSGNCVMIGQWPCSSSLLRLRSVRRRLRMRQVIASSTGFLALAAMLLGSAAAQAQSAAADHTLPYRNSYTNSQSLFDQCGDVARGDLFRKVVREKVEHCPYFSESEKAGFRAWATERGAEYAEQSAQASAAGPVPGTPVMVRRCKEFTFTSEYYKLHRLIDRYGRGQAGADDVIEEACGPS
jgi:hypothetical protein